MYRFGIMIENENGTEAPGDKYETRAQAKQWIKERAPYGKTNFRIVSIEEYMAGLSG